MTTYKHPPLPPSLRPIYLLTKNHPIISTPLNCIKMSLIYHEDLALNTIRRSLQKNGQRAFAWVLGCLWWLDQEREQDGQHFVSVWSILVKFSTFYWPQQHVNSNNGDGRWRSFSFSYFWGFFSVMVVFFDEFFSEPWGLRFNQLNF